MILKRVVFPIPLEPTRPVILFSSTKRHKSKRIVLFFEYVRKRSKKYRKWKEKFYQSKIVRHHFETGKINREGISHYKKYKQNNHSLPVLYGKNHKERNEKQYIFNIVNIQNISDA